MSMLQRITRSVNWSMTSRTFSTCSIALAESTTTTTTKAKPTGLYQFFENGEALPKQNWTGNNQRRRFLNVGSID
jgi:large subunit ribosomal protein L47